MKTLLLVLPPLPLLTGCALNQNIAFVSECPQATSPEASISEHPAHRTVLTELLITPFEHQANSTQHHNGPSLIAGDWLAFQMADIGNYWDLMDAMPTFAEVPQ